MVSNRREFLRRAGGALAGLAASRDLLPEAPAIPASRKEGAHKPIRGLMLDAARLPESLDYYRRVVEFCADWQFNTIQFRLTDDQGSALGFRSVPDLITHRDAFTPEELKDFVEFAQRHGVDVIPEVESFGHTGYITRSARYAHLLDADEKGSSEFTGVIPVAPESLEIFEKLYREVGALFPSEYLHAGCDEVNWGGSPQSRAALQMKSRAEIWAEYLNSLNKITGGMGKGMIVWGDYVLHKEPEILRKLDKNVTIMDWNYVETSAARIHDAMVQAKQSGFHAIGAPALINYQWGPRVGNQQLRNLEAFAESYCETEDPTSLGVVLTNWVPSRYIQNSIWDGFAYAGIAFNEGTGAARAAGLERFVERHYGATWSEKWSEAFHQIYDAAPGIHEGVPNSSSDTRLTVPWSSDQQLAALIKNGSHRPNPFTKLHALLAQLEPSVSKNRGDFKAFVLCVGYLETAFWREQVVLEAAAKNSLGQESAKSLIQTIAARDRGLSEQLSRDWDEGRPPDSEGKHEPIFGLEPKDQLLWQWQRAAAYSTDLALHPDRFFQFLRRPGFHPAG